MAHARGSIDKNRGTLPPHPPGRRRRGGYARCPGARPRGALRSQQTERRWACRAATACLGDSGLLGAPGRLYGATAIAALIAPSDAAGVGVLSKDYNGEFTFAARLRNPVTLLSAREAGAWLAADPDRALIARLEDPDAEVRDFTAQSLAAITGEDFGQDIEQWREWWSGQD